MDLKGITWMGQVYQKFEAMCLEVEEVMYQDTVNYVENQVQTVGASVKKFYSEVMQDVMYDFLPPCSMDPLEKDAGKHKKPHLGLKEDTFNVDSELPEYSEVTADVIEETTHEPSFHGLHSVDNSFDSSSDRFVKAYYLSSVKRRNRSMHNKSNQECLPVSGRSPQTTYMKKELCRTSSFCENTKANHGVPCHQMPATSTPVSVEADDSTSVEGSFHENENGSESIQGISNYDSTLVESIGRRELEVRCSSDAGMSAESNGSLAGMVSVAGSSTDGDTNCNKSCDVVLNSHPGGSDDWTMDTMESATVREQGTEGIQQFTKIGVDESCIMVSGNEHFASEERKRRPYKKKIRDAISSRMRLSRKKEYEQLAMLHGDDAESNKGGLMPTLSRKDTGISSNNDLLESEWELL